MGSIKVGHKSHIPKVMFICAVSRPDPDHDFDGKIGIWRVCHLQEVKRATKNRRRGKIYEVDTTVDAAWYESWYINNLLPAIKEKMPRQEFHEICVQQDSATPHTGQDNPGKLNLAGNAGGWNTKLVT